jgi:hypothetical protein
LPIPSTATHSEVEGQLTAVIPFAPPEESDRTAALQLNGTCAAALLAPIAPAHATAARAKPARRARRLLVTMLVLSCVVARRDVGSPNPQPA